MPFVPCFTFKCQHCSKDFGFENTMYLHQASCSKNPKMNSIPTQFLHSSNYNTRHRQSRVEVEPAPAPQQAEASAAEIAIDDGDGDALKVKGRSRKHRKYPTRQSKRDESNQELTTPSTVAVALLESADKNAHNLEKPKESDRHVPQPLSTSKPKLDKLPFQKSSNEEVAAASKKVFSVAASDQEGTELEKSESPPTKMQAETVEEAQHIDYQPVTLFQCNYCPKTFSRNLKRILHQQRGHYFTRMPLKSNLSTRRFSLQSRDETVFKKTASATVSLKSGCDSDCESSTSSESESSSSSSSSSTSYETETVSEDLTGANVEFQLPEEHAMELPKTEINQPLFKSDAELLQYLTCIAIKGQKAYFICSICDKKLKTREGANAHIRLHLCEKPFQCSYCDVDPWSSAILELFKYFNSLDFQFVKF